MKTDARVRYTKKVLREALLKCMETRPVNQITVKEVCELAGLNRATFYKHYRDCFDLLEQLENEMLEQLGESLRDLSSLDAKALVSSIFDMIDSNYELCRVLVFSGNDVTFVRKIVALARERSVPLWKKYLKRATDEEMDMLFICLASGLLMVIEQTYGKYDREQVTRFVNSTVKNCLSPYV